MAVEPKQINQYSVSAICPDCGIVTVFDYRRDGGEIGSILINIGHSYNNAAFSRVHWRLLKCSSCSRGGLGKFHDNGNGESAVLESFVPRSVARALLPATVPNGIVKEYREAELCVSVEAWRAASALLRSALEKALKANGYTSGSLQQKIDNACSDGVITAARKQKAHDDIRVLGNEVVHDDWRPVNADEVEAALHYTQRILEDLYDDRGAVEAVLASKGRL